MTILCDRCKQEIEAEGDIAIPPIHRVDPARLPSVSAVDRSRLPMAGGVYFAIVRDQIGYVGETGNLVQRWAHHPILPRLMAQTAGRIAWLVVRDKTQRRKLEREAIRFFKPKWNRGGDAYAASTFYPRISDFNRQMKYGHSAKWETDAEIQRRQLWTLGALLTPASPARA